MAAESAPDDRTTPCLRILSEGLPETSETLNLLAGLSLTNRPNGVRQFPERPPRKFKKQLLRTPTNMSSGAMEITNPKVIRYLGVHVRAHGFAFVVTENAAVHDSGVRLCDHTDFADCLGKRFSRLLRTFQPDIVVLSQTGSATTRTRRRTISSEVTGRSKYHRATTITISTSAVRRYFGKRGARTRFEMAQEVVRVLPELGWKLPSRRKPWQSERYNSAIFDAAAALIASKGRLTF